MGKKIRMIALLVVICMVATLLPIGSLEKYEASEKVDAKFLELLGVTYEELISGDFTDSGETYSCIIWLQDVEIENAVEAGIEAAEETREENSVLGAYDYPYTTYEAEGLTYVDVKFAENETDEYVQTYIEAEREAAKELYTKNNNDFVTENFMARDMSVTYVSQYSPCVFADLSVTKIAELIKKDNVTCIDEFSDEGVIEDNSEDEVADPTQPTFSLLEVEEGMEIIAADQAISRYNVTGEGVKVGQIEVRCPDTDTVIKHPIYNCTEVDEIGNSHADNVHFIMETVAPDATYYAISQYDENSTLGSFTEQVEWLLAQGVNVINYSAGFYDSYNEYDSRSRWIDHIAYNHDVHFVKSAGNYRNDINPGNDIGSPGMAYNIITVGATNRTYPYAIRGASSYNDAGIGRYVFRTNKPDMCAPGEFTPDSGTSYSAPYVTATIALLCDYAPALKTRQHLVKAILAASVGRETQHYTSQDENFGRYGAGIIDARAAIWVAKESNFSSSTGTLSARGSTKTYEIEVTSSDTFIRVALAYANRVKFATGVEHNEENTPREEMLIADLALSVYAPDGDLVVQTIGFGRNLLVVEFDPSLYYGPGTYVVEVKVQEEADNGEKVNFDVAWR